MSEQERPFEEMIEAEKSTLAYETVYAEVLFGRPGYDEAKLDDIERRRRLLVESPTLYFAEKTVRDESRRTFLENHPGAQADIDDFRERAKKFSEAIKLTKKGDNNE